MARDYLPSDWEGRGNRTVDYRRRTEGKGEARMVGGGDPAGRMVMRAALTLVAAIFATPNVAGAQTPGAHAPVGEFRPPTPAQQYRQDSTRNNLVHPEGYRTAPRNSLGRVEQHGEGSTPLVLLAGLGFGGDVFDSLVPALVKEHTLYVVTLPGFGGSSAPPMPPEGTSFGERSWLANAERGLETFLADEGLERPILVALYSDAANVVTHFARANPDRVGGLLLVSASARFPLPSSGPARAERMDAFAGQWFRTVTEIMWPSGMFPPSFYATDPAVAEYAWWRVLEPTLPTSIRYTVEAWADDLVPVVAAVEVPVVVLSPDFAWLEGGRRETTRARFQGGWEEAVEQGGGLEHRVIEGARFLIWEDAPEALDRALRDLSGSR